jgi:hypothetical protein
MSKKTQATPPVPPEETQATPPVSPEVQPVIDTDDNTFCSLELKETLNRCVNVKEVYVTEDGKWHFHKPLKKHVIFTRDEILK